MKRRIGIYKDKILVEDSKGATLSYEIDIDSIKGKSDNNEGEGGGQFPSVKCYYYKFNSDLMSEEYEPFKIMLYGGGSYCERICKTSVENVYYVSSETQEALNARGLAYFKLIDITTYTTMEFYEDGNSQVSYISLSGDIFDRLLQFMKNTIGPDITREYIIQILGGFYTEITEEEYNKIAPYNK